MWRTNEPVRELTADDLGIGVEEAIEEHGSSRPDDEPLADDDPRYLEVLELLERFGGVIFSGPPGTSKSYFAGKIASKLADNHDDRVRYVQFHPSYQYEDFMQGFVPRKTADGFDFKDKHFVAMCVEARKEENADETYVLVIDELSRGDPGRVFGEALTYVERSKRGLQFTLASGDACVVPGNLVVLATMNPLDRGVDEVDAAFERRFAKIAMEPDRDVLAKLLDKNNVEQSLRGRIIGFFDNVNRRAKFNPLASVGHTFFLDVTDQDSLRSLWDHQLRFLFEKAYRLDTEALREIERDFKRTLNGKPKEAGTREPDEPDAGEAAADETADQGP
jgi:5-methylcytosine-specific restriction protein B